jgi:hypothetical protein
MLSTLSIIWDIFDALDIVIIWDIFDALDIVHYLRYI